MASRRLSKPSDNSESPFLETPRLKSFCFTKESSSSFLPCRPPDIEWEVVGKRELEMICEENCERIGETSLEERILQQQHETTLEETHNI